MQAKSQASATKAPSAVTASHDSGKQQTIAVPNPSAAGFAKLPAPTQGQTYGPSAPPVQETKPVAAIQEKQSEQKPAIADSKQPDQAKNDQQKTASASQAADAKLATEMGRNPLEDLAKQTAQKAQAFAALDNEKARVPAPGDIPAAPGTTTKDEHMPVPPAAVVTSTTANPKSGETAKPPVDSDHLPAVERPGAKSSSADDNTALASLTPDGVQTTDTTGKDTSKFRRQTPKAAELKASQVVQFPQRMVIEYESGDAADPFSSLIRIDKASRRNMDLSRVPTIDALNLVGILHAEDGKSAALMEDLDGIGYILKPGDRVKNGYVGQIDDQAISFQISEYGWDRTVTKYLQKEE